MIAQELVFPSGYKPLVVSHPYFGTAVPLWPEEQALAPNSVPSYVSDASTNDFVKTADLMTSKGPKEYQNPKQP